jgi:hypothetical protein
VGHSLLPQEFNSFSHGVYDKDAQIQFDYSENPMDDWNRPDQDQPLAPLFRPSIAVFQHVNAFHVQELELAAIYDHVASSTNKLHEIRSEERGR